MAIQSREGKGRGWLWAGAFASALTMTPAAPFRMDASAQTRATAGAELARVGGNYIRATDATAPGQILTELGRFPYAQNRAEAFQNLEAAIDALIASENIDVRHRDAILRTVRADSNFANFSITGVHPAEISSGEVVDAMMSRGGRVIGTGSQLVRMNTPVVEGRTGRVGYRAERWVVDLGADGLLVITLPAECNNWAVKLIPRSEIAVAAPVASEDIPCIDVRLNNEAIVRAGGRVIEGQTGVMRIARRDGLDMSPAEVEIFRTCMARTIELSGDPLRPCPDCELTRENRDRLASLVVFTDRTGLRARTGINPSEYSVNYVARFRALPETNGDILFAVPTPTIENGRVYNHPVWCYDIELGGRIYRLEFQGEEDNHLLQRAADSGSMTVNMGNEAFVWQEVRDGRLSRERYNFRDGRMVVDRDWESGYRGQ